MTDQNIEEITEANKETNEVVENKKKTEQKSTTSLGSYLVSLRESQNISLKQISIETRITETVLKNLELGNFEKLPKRIYLQGFIKTYCQYLGLSHKEAIILLNEEFSQKENRPDIEGRVNLYDSVENSSSNKMTKLIIPLVIIGVGTTLWNFFSENEIKTSREKVQKISAEKLTSSTPLLKPTNKAFIQEKNEETPIEDTKEEKLEEETQVQKVTFKPFPRGNYILSKNSNVDEIFSENSLIAESDFSEVVIIKATRGDSWIAYQKDNAEIKQVILKEGKELYLTSDFIKLVIGNSTAIDLAHNKKLLEVASGSGIRSLVFPPTTDKKLQLPLFYTNEKGIFVSSPEL